ncbi:hypothetical protein H8E07_03255 [bacterium]|nr:hypothetical protein [bacterium]
MTWSVQGRGGDRQIDEAYEALRANVLRASGGGLGQAVVLHKGVGAWVVAWRSLAPAGRSGFGPRPRSKPVPAGHASNTNRAPTVPIAEAARLLASMVLSNLQGLRA